MNNKVLVEILVPEIEETYTVFLPTNKRVGNILVLITKAINDLSNGNYEVTTRNALYNRITGEKYSLNSIIRETDIRNGSKLVLL